MTQLPKGVKITCAWSECPERFSLCCGAGSKEVIADEGTGYFACSKCGKEFIGGECTAAERNNYMQVGRTIECGNCHPEKSEIYVHCSKVPFPDGCNCICHDKPSSESWEEQFDKLNIQFSAYGYIIGLPDEVAQQLKSFISSLLTTEIYKAVQKERKIWFDAEKTIKATERKRVLEEVEGMVEDVKEELINAVEEYVEGEKDEQKRVHDGICFDDGYNEALSTLKAKLQSMK